MLIVRERHGRRVITWFLALNCNFRLNRFLMPTFGTVFPWPRIIWSTEDFHMFRQPSDILTSINRTFPPLLFMLHYLDIVLWLELHQHLMKKDILFSKLKVDLSAEHFRPIHGSCLPSDAHGPQRWMWYSFNGNDLTTNHMWIKHLWYAVYTGHQQTTTNGGNASFYHM